MRALYNRLVRIVRANSMLTMVGVGAGRGVIAEVARLGCDLGFRMVEPVA